MFKKVNINENHLYILTLFTRSKEYYIREISRLADLNLRTCWLILSDLEKKGVLEARNIGKTKLYSLRKNYTAFNYMLLTEEYKRNCFLQQYPLIREVLDKMIPLIKGTVVIFGSYAKNIPKDDSDLDLLISGTFFPDKLKAISQTYGIELNIKKYPLKLIKSKISSDFLLKEVVKDHIIIKGEFGEIIYG